MTPANLSHLKLWRGLGRILVAAMMVVSVLPMPRVIGAVPSGDKIGHALAFCGLVLFYAQIYPLQRDRWRCVLGAIAFGALIEIVQSFVPYRSAEFLDLAADTVGALGGLALASTPLGAVLRRWDPPRPA
jgi:hypothetical protein